MADVWFVVHQKDLWDIDNRLIGFYDKYQSDLIKEGDYVIYLRTGYSRIMGVFKVIEKGNPLNPDFTSSKITAKTVYQSRLKLITDYIRVDKPNKEPRLSFLPEYHKSFSGRYKQVFRATKEDLKLIIADPSVANDL